MHHATETKRFRQRFSFDIKRHIGVLSTTPEGGQKNSILFPIMAAAASDIRLWSEDHQKMGKGITLVREEADILYALLTNMRNKEAPMRGQR